jgi:hypothetical protein
MILMFDMIDTKVQVPTQVGCKGRLMIFKENIILHMGNAKMLI